MVMSIAAAPRFRRYVLVYLALLVACVLGWRYVLAPRLDEGSRILAALDPKQRGKWFGANASPFLEDVVQVRELDEELLPAGLAPEGNGSSRRRLVVVGDVHGCKSDCTYSPGWVGLCMNEPG